MTMWRGLAVLIAAAMTWLSVTPSMAANCVPANITMFTVSPVNMGSYSPYSSAPLTGSFTVNIGVNANCTNLYLGVSAAGGTFAPSAPGLSYTLMGNPPVPGNELKTNANNIDLSRTFGVSIAAGQIAPAGFHIATGSPIRVILYLKERGDLIPVPGRSLPLPISVTVLPGCQLPLPSLSNVDFTAALTTGLPNPGVVRTVVFTGASCLAPARIQLSGAALRPMFTIPPRPGFDTMINWHAQARFGLATVDLNTTGTSGTNAISLGRNTTIGAGSGNLTVDINLLSGTRPQAGTYSGTLKVTIDPSL